MSALAADDDDCCGPMACGPSGSSGSARLAAARRAAAPPQHRYSALAPFGVSVRLHYLAKDTGRLASALCVMRLKLPSRWLSFDCVHDSAWPKQLDAGL